MTDRDDERPRVTGRTDASVAPRADRNARLPPFRLDADRPVRYRCGRFTRPRELHILWN